jgi:hypothetical protein
MPGSRTNDDRKISDSRSNDTSSPYDIHNTLIAVGPAFREHATSDVPTGMGDEVGDAEAR